MPMLGQPESFIQVKEGFYDDAGNIGAGSKQFLQGRMDRYAAWVKKHAAYCAWRLASSRCARPMPPARMRAS